MEQNQQSAGNGKTILRRSEEEIMKLLDEQEKSGYTVKEYCELYDIVEQTFYSWIRKYRNKQEEQGGFASIEVVPTLTAPQLFAEIGKIKLYKEVSAEYLKTLLS